MNLASERYSYYRPLDWEKNNDENGNKWFLRFAWLPTHVGWNKKTNRREYVWLKDYEQAGHHSFIGNGPTVGCYRRPVGNPHVKPHCVFWGF